MEVIDLSNLPTSDSDEGDEVSREELQKVVDGMTEARLRKIVIRLANKTLALRSALVKEAMVVHGKERQASPGQWDVCANCGEEYDMTDEGDDDECDYHTGRLEGDFPDWEDQDLDPMDPESNADQYPEAFTWDCCRELNGEWSKGCETGYHVPGGTFKKRKRS
ncbi:hypothetical protein EDB19DRAFT_1884365 [Suillus lakei]|nr:hypothetical protein EDB19DRAFT_1884365 [Suillus lakei]